MSIAASQDKDLRASVIFIAKTLFIPYTILDKNLPKGHLYIMIRLILVAVFLISFLVLSIPILIAEWLIGKYNMPLKDKSSLVIVQWAFRVILFFSGVRLDVRGEENIPKDTLSKFIIFNKLIRYACILVTITFAAWCIQFVYSVRKSAVTEIEIQTIVYPEVLDENTRKE